MAWRPRGGGRGRGARHFVAPGRRAATVAPDGQQVQFVGSELFRSYCVACHGKAGLGDGVLLDLMKKRPPDLTQFTRSNGGVFRLSS
jgi:mono/diheme cytochrome c family protein